MVGWTERRIDRWINDRTDGSTYQRDKARFRVTSTVPKKQKSKRKKKLRKQRNVIPSVTKIESKYEPAQEFFVFVLN